MCSSLCNVTLKKKEEETSFTIVHFMDFSCINNPLSTHHTAVECGNKKSPTKCNILTVSTTVEVLHTHTHTMLIPTEFFEGMKKTKTKTNLKCKKKNKESK